VHLLDGIVWRGSGAADAGLPEPHEINKASAVPQYGTGLTKHPGQDLLPLLMLLDIPILTDAVMCFQGFGNESPGTFHFDSFSLAILPAL